MKDRSVNKNEDGKERMWDVYDYMVCCISLGLGFRYYRNSRNKTLMIELAKNKILYLDFELWTSCMQRAVVYMDEVQMPIGLSGVGELIVQEGKRRSVTVTKELKKWVRILYTNDISFEWLETKLKIVTEKNKDFVIEIGFGANGVREARYQLGQEVHHFYFGESLESVVFRTLDAIETKESKMA